MTTARTIQAPAAALAGMDAVAIPLIAVALGLPALYNGFPLIFPDSGTYLEIAFGKAYAIDRSSIYGFMLKPLVGLAPGTAGLWIAIAAQLLAVASILWSAARTLTGRFAHAGVAVGACVIVTAAAFHASQFMPDAFTAPAVLLAWLAARRDPSANGAPLLWVAVTLLALVHYTHMPLVAVAVAATLGAQRLFGLAWSSVGKRAAAAAASLGVAVVVQILLNGAVLGQPRVAPLGSLFLYARLNEDGLMKPWLDRHCGNGAPPALCAVAGDMPRDSQALLWGGERTPVTRLVWHADEKTRWQTIGEMKIAARGAVSEAPSAFADSSMAGAARQFVAFAPLDDECPVGCRERSGGIANALQRYRADALPALDASAQVTDTMPKSAIRALFVPVGALALLLLPAFAWSAWRRRDADGLALVGAVAATLVVNAVLAGALSDVHDRYQSRLVWLAPLAIALLSARWRLWREAGGLTLAWRRAIIARAG